MKHIHIVSLSPRSGTTLLMELMKSSYHIGYGSEHEERIGDPVIKNCDVYLTKSPKDLVVMPTILKKIKNIYTIVVIRDPRDIAVSKHKEHPDKYFGSIQYWVNYKPYYDKMGNHPRVMTIKYEDLVDDPDAIQNEISAKFKFLKKKHNFSEFVTSSNVSEKAKLALNGVRKIDTSSIGNWKNHKPRLKAEFERFGKITEDLIDFEYEKSPDWEKQLQDVQPDFSKHRNSLFAKKKFIQKKQRTQFLRVPKVWLYHSKLYLKSLDLLKG